MAARGGVDQIEMRVDLLEAAGEVRVDLAHAVRRRVALQDDDPEAPAVQPSDLALHLVDAGARPADDRHRVSADLRADELVDVGHVLEVLRRIDQLVDRAQPVRGVPQQVRRLPAAPALEGELVRPQLVDRRLGLGEEVRGQRAQVLELQPLRVDHALEPQERHDAGARLAVPLVQADVVQEHPQGQHGVQVGVVGVHRPVAAAEIEALPDEHHGLLARG